MRKPVRINLGAGAKPKEGYVNQDISKLKGIDIVFDLNVFPWPYKDDSVDEILIFDVLEHLYDVCAVIKEIHRILRPGGVVKLIIPHWNSNGPTYDPTHKHGFGYTTFAYFVRGLQADHAHYFDFEFSKLHRRITFSRGWQIWNRIIEPLANWFPNFYETTPMKIFPSQGLYIEMTK